MLRRIPKPIRIYLAVLAGFTLVILGTFGIAEFKHRLKPPSQIIGEIAPEPEHILKIFAWENAWNADMTAETNILTEMTEGDAIRVGWLKTGIATFWGDNGDTTERAGYYSYSYDDAVTRGSHDSVFIAEYDGQIRIESNSRPLFSGELSGGRLSHVTLSQILDGEFNGRSRVVIGANSSGTLQCDRIAVRESAPGELYYRSFAQTMAEAWPERSLPHEYRKIPRFGETVTLLISAMDDADPEKVVAQAEIRLTKYQLWELVPSPNPFWDGETYRNILVGLDLNHPDNYGYTEAVLVNYWQLDGLQ